MKKVIMLNLSRKKDKVDFVPLNKRKIGSDIQARILTADRYFPWNGSDVDKFDRIWGDLDYITGIPFLIYSENIHKYDEYESVHPAFSIRFIFYLLLIVCKSWILGTFKDKRLYLEHTPLSVVKYIVLGFMVDTKYFKQILRWQLTYSTLRCYFLKNKTDVLIYHGEFNGWGMAVSWACRDSGVVPIAHQHGVVGPEYAQYKNLGNIVNYIASALLLNSENQYNFFKSLPIKTYLAGSRRLKFIETEHKKEINYLVIPTITDTKFFQKEIRKSHLNFHVKPHPLRKSGWNYDNVTLVEENIESLICKSKVVIASAGTSLIYAIKHRIKLILIDCADSCKDRFIIENNLPKTLDEAIEANRFIVVNDYGYYYKKCDPDEYLKIIGEIYDNETYSVSEFNKSKNV